eukprot:scaffold422835_cov28-Prasinocladus_malaysianus.AAC.1
MSPGMLPGGREAAVRRALRPFILSDISMRGLYGKVIIPRVTLGTWSLWQICSSSYHRKL